MPILLFLMGAATLALVASQSSAKKGSSSSAPPGPSPASFALDAQLDPQLRAQVQAALGNEMDPARLEAFATELAARHPYATWYLRAKAAGLRNLGYGATLGLPAPATTTRSDGLDPNLPDNVRFNVVELVTHGSDPATLEAFAAQLTAYPLAAAALRLRAAFLRSLGTSATPRSGQPGAAIPPALPARPEAVPSPTLPPLPGLDPGMTPDIAARVATSLLTENDPAKLRALGNELMASYPTAATMLLGKANTLSPPQAPAPSANVPVEAPPQPASPTPSPQVVPAPRTPPAGLPAPPIMLPPPALPDAPGLFDAGMSQEEQMRVMTALSAENDPAKLRQLGDAIAGRYPKAALLLSNKAAAISTMFLPGMLPSVQPPASPPPAPTPPLALPAAPTPAARTYKVKDGDFPIKITKKFGRPESAWKELVAANPQKPTRPDGNFKQLLPGELLNVPPSWPDESGQVAPQLLLAAPAPSPPPPAPLPAPSLPGASQGLDPGIPVDVATAVMTALATEKDPAKLRGFASSIMAQYPVAAGVLLAKANTLGVLVSAPATTPQPSGPKPADVKNPAPTPAASTAAPSANDARVYRVQSGDSPSRIAKNLTGNDARWPELVAANAQKPKQANGNFKSLQPGEVLKLPASWSTSSTTNGAAQTARA